MRRLVVGVRNEAWSATDGNDRAQCKGTFSTLTILPRRAWRRTARHVDSAIFCAPTAGTTHAGRKQMVLSFVVCRRVLGCVMDGYSPTILVGEQDVSCLGGRGFYVMPQEVFFKFDWRPF